MSKFDVVGWSHKYREVLDDFGLVEFGMDSDELEHPAHIVDKVMDALRHHDLIVQKIQLGLPAVQSRSLRNFETISEVVRS